MLNVKITNRMSHEDYVAEVTDSPYVLPRKHIFAIMAIIGASACFVLPNPELWGQASDPYTITAQTEAYLNTDETLAEEKLKTEEATQPHQENYDDYDIPSAQFDTPPDQLAKEQQEQIEAKNTAEDVARSEAEIAANEAKAQAEAAKKAAEEDAAKKVAEAVLADKKKAEAEAELARQAELAQQKAREEQERQEQELARIEAEKKKAEQEKAKKEQATQPVEPSTSTPTEKAEKPAVEEKKGEKDTATDVEATQPSTEESTTPAEKPSPETKDDGTAEAKKPDTTEKPVVAPETAAGKPTTEEGKTDATETTPKEGETAETTPAEPIIWYSQTVKQGDSLYSIFRYLNLNTGSLARITKVAKRRDLNINIGDTIYFRINDKNELLAMVKPLKGKKQQVHYSRKGDTDFFEYDYEDVDAHIADKKKTTVKDASYMPQAVQAQKDRQNEVDKIEKDKAYYAANAQKHNNYNPYRPRLVIAEVRKGESFKNAAHRAGLTPSEVKTIASIFSQKINVYKLVPGDRFRVLFTGIGTRAYVNAVDLDTKRGHFESFRNPEDKNYYGEHDYTPTAGVFRRFPLAGEIRVTSNFNPHRRHPVTGKIRPHNGVDFKAAVGTPVYAPADGVVTFSGYQRAAGYYIIVRHAKNMSTVYMHLSKSEVKAGDKVVVGQVIARSGNTGRTTGPHLHYEIRINNKPVNPLKVKLPSSAHPNLAREQREAFANNVKLLRADLQNDRLAAMD